MPIDVSVDDIVRNIGANVKFHQPLYEAVLNSLEAGAENIEITFFHDSPLNNIVPKITGFTIIDDGEGFTQKNRDAFNVLWTKNKIALGCKGSGRFTWLSVYYNINIHSTIMKEGVEIYIPFSKEYDKSQIKIRSLQIEKNKTIISFNNVTEKFYNVTRGGKINDKRPLANLNEIYENLKEYLLIKLFFMKQEGKFFQIKLIMDNIILVIDAQSIPNLEKEEFTIDSEIDEQTFNFELYYHFIHDSQNKKKVYYCSNQRATQEVDDEVLGFSCKLPQKDSFIMLLCSDYFDGKDDDSRSNLTDLTHQKRASKFIPLLISDINLRVKNVIASIIKKQYPELEKQNQKAINEAIEKAPHLSQYFKEDTDIVKTPDSLLTNARRKFADTKIKSQDQFVRLLERKNINSIELKKEIESVSAIAAAELGEYILYRDNIIKALLRATENEEYKEKYIHDIFMPMKSESFKFDDNKQLLSNLWLIDDKFMTYSYAASDKTVIQIKNALGNKSSMFYGRLNRPDLALFFDRNEGKKDVIMVEFKGANSSHEEKNKSLTELPIDIRIIRENIDEVGSIWSYIITTIDDELKYTIESIDNYISLFSIESQNRAYYSFNKASNAHIYIIDLKTIISDAFARNKTFLDILKKQ